MWCLGLVWSACAYRVPCLPKLVLLYRCAQSGYEESTAVLMMTMMMFMCYTRGVGGGD